LRISPEAPVPIVNVKNTEHRAGGAGNVALNVASLSGHAGIMSIIGEDAAGAMLKGMFVDAGVETFLLKDKYPTITKLRILSQQQQLLRMDFEEDLFNADKGSLVAAL